MKKIIFCLLAVLCLTSETFLQQIQHAFLRFDVDNNGIVTSEEILNAVAQDMGADQISQDMEGVVSKMFMQYDLNVNGLDFAEFYKASGGNT